MTRLESSKIVFLPGLCPTVDICSTLFAQCHQCFGLWLVASEECKVQWVNFSKYDLCFEFTFSLL